MYTSIIASIDEGDAQYDGGRQTVISDEELDELVKQYAPGRFHSIWED